ncbi:radial spoke head protein 3 homolog [Diachasma alloeum]|uniref:radial spoke head protein 3 homolog n=1 Tax=Diachasma alloeum TaxID=454923 RepID=UPI00073844AA|nr:radial spoke head protein 3 homolog [Diachasma alloeum]
MPAGISALAPFDCGSHKAQTAPAFTVIHRDNLQTTLPILHINQMNDDYPKVNGNRPRKNERNGLLSEKRISRSSDHFVLASLQNNQVNPLKRREHSKSHDNLGLSTKKTDESLKSAMSLSTENFNDILNAKLQKVQDQEHQELSRKVGLRNKQQMVNLKKPFITTVKSGEFLMPPPEVAALLGISPNGTWLGNETVEHGPDDIPPRSRFRPLVSLGHRPEVRHNKHNARCQAALKATVDFTVKLVNSTTLANEERVKRLCNSRLTTINSAENDHQQLPFGNIMFDRRVVRGTTLAAPMLLEGEHSPCKKKQMAKKRSQQQASRSMMLRIKSPPPIPGRKHEPVQTEMYLEELYEKPDESEIGTQTDYFLERPATPPYIPGKTGLDAETQISPGDLFDYDSEVQPILEVLVGKTIEQALIEVLEEEEQTALREQQRRFLELRAAEKAEQQRLEEEERRLREEKDRRVKQHEKAVHEQQETEERVAAAVLLTGYIAELLPAVLEDLKMSGFLLDEIRGDIEEGFVPWLMNEVKREMGTVMESREILAEIIKEILENRATIYKKLGEEYDSSRELTVARYDSQTEIEESGGGRDVDFERYQSPNAIQ